MQTWSVNIIMEKRSVLVTGSSKGLGREIAMAAGKAGFRVIVNYLTNETGAREVVNDITRHGQEAISVKADVTSPSAVDRMFERIQSEYGELYGLINNVGLYKDATVWKMSPLVCNEVIHANLTSAYLCTRASIPFMRRLNRGRIVNISSVVGQTGVFGTSNYAAAKAGLFGLTKTVAKEVAKFGITVNCMVLGYFELGMFLRLPETTRKSIIDQIPLGRPGTANEITAPILFLLSEGASYLTGQLIHVNGGCYM
jgi:3-oxoacyl-[acyl-carrier protein] reductase